MGNSGNLVPKLQQAVSVYRTYLEAQVILANAKQTNVDEGEIAELQRHYDLATQAKNNLGLNKADEKAVLVIIYEQIPEEERNWRGSTGYRSRVDPGMTMPGPGIGRHQRRQDVRDGQPR